jgi:hypothetical protein
MMRCRRKPPPSGADGKLVGVTIVNARWLLAQGDPITVTVPQHLAVDPGALAQVIGSAA